MADLSEKEEEGKYYSGSVEISEEPSLLLINAHLPLCLCFPEEVVPSPPAPFWREDPAAAVAPEADPAAGTT